MTELINLKPARTYAQQPVYICEMCAVYAVNRDTSAMEPEEEQQIIAAHSEISKRGWRIEPVDPYDFHFSMNRCDTCKSTLGGNRMDAYLISNYSGEMAAETALVIQRDGSSAYTADEIAALMISDIRSLRPELDIYLPGQSAEDDSADGEDLYWLCEDHKSAGSALELLIIEDDGYQIYDLRLITEAEIESLSQMMEEQR